jgi:hypothetical protein
MLIKKASQEELNEKNEVEEVEDSESVSEDEIEQKSLQNSYIEKKNEFSLEKIKSIFNKKKNEKKEDEDQKLSTSDDPMAVILLEEKESRQKNEQMEKEEMEGYKKIVDEKGVDGVKTVISMIKKKYPTNYYFKIDEFHDTLIDHLAQNKDKK